MVINSYMKTCNKKGWLRIVEAVMAILIVFGAVLYITSKQTYKPDITDDVYKKADDILNVISKNESLRSYVLTKNNVLLESAISRMIPVSWNFSTCIIGNISLICSPVTPKDRNVYVKEILIVSSLQQYSPHKLRLFIWMK